MKKTAIILLACVAFSACTKNVNDVETPQTQGTPATFAAVTEDLDDLTKTVYQSSQVWWNNNDAIDVIYNSAEGQVKVKFTTPGNGSDPENPVAVVFNGTLSEKKVAGEPYCAVYPTSNDNALSDGKIIFVTKDFTQTISQGYSFAKGVNHTFAKTVDDQPDGGNTLYFKNAQSLLKFTVPADLAGTDNLVSVAFTPNNKACSFNGTYICEWDKDAPSVTFEPNTSNMTVTAKNNASSGWKGNQPYYVTLPPVTYTDGIMVDIELGNNKHIVRYNFKDFTAVRAKMHNIGTLPTIADLSAVNLSTDVPNGSPMPAFFTSPTTATGEYSIVDGALKIEKTSTGGTTGYFNILATDEAVGSYNVLRFKIKYHKDLKITNGDHLVHVRVQGNGGSRVYASRVNGKGQDTEVSPVVVDGETWNIVEVDIKDVKSDVNNFKQVGVTICPFASNLTASSCNSNGENRTCWIKDIEFIKK